jgi:hypothetical protein
MTNRAGDLLPLAEAADVFQTMPPELRIASLHPGMVEVDAKRDGSLSPVYWCYRDADQCFMHSFHLSDNPGLDVKDIQSAYGYGGPISNSDNPGFLQAAGAAFQLWAKENAVVAEFIRLHPCLPQRKWYSGETVFNRETVYLDLQQDLLKQYEARRRAYVRRFLESGLEVKRVGPSVMQGVFPQMYADHMARIGADQSYFFSPAYFSSLFEFCWAESWLVYLEGQPIAGTVVLASSQARIAEYHLGANVPGFEQHRAMLGMLHQVATHYQSQGYRYFYLGGGRSVAADDSLLFFKKGFSHATKPFFIGMRINDHEAYDQLKALFPDRAATGRVLFYKD